MKTRIRLALSEPHPHLGPLISSYQDGLASAAEVQMVEAHLQACERCYHFYQNLQLARELVQAQAAKASSQAVWEQTEAASYYAIVERTIQRDKLKKGKKARNQMHSLHNFEYFSEAARQVLVAAQQEAKGFNQAYIGTEHLLLGLLQEEDSLLVPLLAGFKVELPQLREAIEARIGRGNQGVAPTPTGELGVTPRAKRAFEFARLEARSLRHLKVEPEHLLLGLMREKEGLAAGVLYNLGIPFRAAQEQIRQLALSRYPVQPLPPRKGLAQLISDLWRKRA